jgi:hypothetical protein
VTALHPSAGPVGGGTFVDIAGRNFEGTTSVHFGPTTAPRFKVLSPYAIAAVAPAGSGTVKMTVTTHQSTSKMRQADRYSYFKQPTVHDGPAIASVGPAKGSVIGGTGVVITGQDLSGAYLVTFGGIPCSQIRVLSDTKLKVIAPAAPIAAQISVVVTTPKGSSTPTTADKYSYG